MIRSMTAFARASSEQAGAELTWELRSVNHRYLEAFVRLPEELRAHGATGSRTGDSAAGARQARVCAALSLGTRADKRARD